MKKIAISVGSFVATILAFQLWFKDWTLVAIVVGSVIAHELGHALTLIMYKQRVSNIVFVPFLGAAVIPDGDVFKKLTYFSTAVVGLAGPLTNMVLALVGFFLYIMMGKNNNYVIGLVAINVSLLYFNLLPFNPFDGGKVLSAIFESSPEHLDKKLELAVVVLAVLGVFTLALLGKFSPIFLLIVWGVWRTSNSDSPNNAYSNKAMSRSRLYGVTCAYAVMLIGGMIVNTLIPNWIELFDVWPANMVSGATTAILLIARHF